MAQSAKNQTQQEQPVRRPLSREEAIAIAKKSWQAIQAQRQQKTVSGVQTQQSVKQPPTPGASNPDHTNKDGSPDKRFVENRGIDSRQPQPRHANTGGQVRQLQQPPVPGRPIAPARPAMQQPPMPNQPEHTTKDGTPDRRFAENRALPPEPKRRDSVGVHRTKNGAPDRRFLENQHLSSRQAEIERAKHVLGVDEEPLKG